VHKPRSFSAEPCSKNAERKQLFFGLRLVSKEFQHPTIQTKTAQHFGGFFHQIKMRQPIERKDSIKTVIRRSRRLDLSLYEVVQNFEVVSNIHN
jgi:hypothetical protein